MKEKKFDIIVIGAGSGGLSVGLFMNKAGFNVLMIALSDEAIGGDCLNDGCVPSKALIHVARMVNDARKAKNFGMEVKGRADMNKVIEYIKKRQSIIRKHENADHLRLLGIDIELGHAKLTSKRTVEVNGKFYEGKNIILATGSLPVKLNVPGVEQVKYYDNKSIFNIDHLPEDLLVVGGGPIGIEMAQAFSRLGSRVTVVHNQENILEHDDPSLTSILFHKLQEEGIRIILNSTLSAFQAPNLAIVQSAKGNKEEIKMDAVFVGIGRRLDTESIGLENAGIRVKDGKILRNSKLQTEGNKHIFLCGDIAGDLQFSHAAEFHARIILNNLFSPLQKKLNNDHMSWVTFTDPELATFGLNEKQLKERDSAYIKLEKSFGDDDRAVTDDYLYGRSILYISKGGWFRKSKILGGTMLAPQAGELVQELILANSAGISVDAIFNKIYPYPVAARINQQVILSHKQKSLTSFLKKILKIAYRIFS